ncbi:midas domain-containing protein [Pseudodesulfovibrio piezophilus]|uniref:Uncharacterized protein n=1 Tax=Pseudodesulfovibrio piezophilus (strain DSM 21447 / JCM 15486 / C1TLV30) TaxID=1322246 RepID=M1WK44_PSEP2|nr:hypothetical protein [Pseudodesulfovibrio piezophilus]CCH48956.1 conserved protein of unknown function [Pseudodesulfovibrio piezophilus C1TLV30]
MTPAPPPPPTDEVNDMLNDGVPDNDVLDPDTVDADFEQELEDLFSDDLEEEAAASAAMAEDNEPIVLDEYVTTEDIDIAIDDPAPVEPEENIETAQTEEDDEGALVLDDVAEDDSEEMMILDDVVEEDDDVMLLDEVIEEVPEVRTDPDDIAALVDDIAEDNTVTPPSADAEEIIELDDLLEQGRPEEVSEAPEEIVELDDLLQETETAPSSDDDTMLLEEMEPEIEPTAEEATEPTLPDDMAETMAEAMVGDEAEDVSTITDLEPETVQVEPMESDKLGDLTEEALTDAEEMLSAEPPVEASEALMAEALSETKDQPEEEGTQELKSDDATSQKHDIEPATPVSSLDETTNAEDVLPTKESGEEISTVPEDMVDLALAEESGPEIPVDEAVLEEDIDLLMDEPASEATPEPASEEDILKTDDNDMSELAGLEALEDEGMDDMDSLLDNVEVDVSDVETSVETDEADLDIPEVDIPDTDFPTIPPTDAAEAALTDAETSDMDTATENVSAMETEEDLGEDLPDEIMAGVDMDEVLTSENMPQDAGIDVSDDVDVNQLLADVRSETSASVIAELQEKVAMLETRVEDLETMLREEIAQLVPAEAARIIREEITALADELEE